MSKKPRKPSGELGGITISKAESKASVVRHHVALPRVKEELEQLFASQFVAKFNEVQPLGGNDKIESLKQNAESDLDFRIEFPGIEYLELAELNPRSEAFGRRGHATGMTNIYEFARWTYEVILKKADKYGAEVAGRTILLLYTTHWQFRPVNGGYIECLQALCLRGGCSFAAVFSCDSDGEKGLYALDKIHPTNRTDFAPPESFANQHMVFSDLGQFQVGEKGEVFFPVGRVQPQGRVAMGTEEVKGGSTIERSRVTTDYVKSADFRVIHVDGLYGGITSSGKIHFALWCERPSIPERTVHELNADGSLGAVVQSEKVSIQRVL